MSSVADNSAYFMSNMIQEPSENCSAAAVQTLQGNELNIGTMQCSGDVNIGSNIVAQTANCTNNIVVAATSKAMSMQKANASTTCANLFPWTCDGSAASMNSSDMQSAIAQYMNARCDATINQSIKGEKYTMNYLNGANCSIITNNADQKFYCINSLTAQASSDQSASQTATATVVDDGGMGLVLIVVAIAIAIVIFMTSGVRMVWGLLTFRFNQGDFDRYDMLEAKLRRLSK
jgi:hypothetical protein